MMGNGILKNSMLCNSDTSQIFFKIIKPFDIKLTSTISIKIRKVKDFKDDNSNANLFGANQNKHHCYDRPSIKRMPDEEIEIKLEQLF